MTDTAAMDYNTCRGVNLLPSVSFFPFEWSNWKQYFMERNHTKNSLSWVPKATIGVHIWNKMSSSEVIRKNSNQYYTSLSKAFCPHTLLSAPETFK